MKTKTSLRVGGFSLVELLVTISVMGIIAAIAIPGFANINGAARDTKDLRNAQTIANIASSALAAGYPAENIATKNDLLARLQEGITVRQGAVSIDFSLSGMAPEDVQSAGNYLEVSEGTVRLVADGTAGESL